jgi:hypothetical protein
MLTCLDSVFNLENGINCKFFCWSLNVFDTLECVSKYLQQYVSGEN